MSAALANSGGIDEQIPSSVAFVLDVDCIPCRARNFTYNRPPVPQQCIDQGRLPGVRPPNDRDRGRMFEVRRMRRRRLGEGGLDFSTGRKERPNLLQQLLYSPAMCRADRKHTLEAERQKLIGPQLMLRIINLINEK